VATDYAPDTGWLIPTPDGVHTGGTYATHVDDQRLRLTMRIPDGWTFDHIVTPNQDQGIGLEFMTVDKAAEWGCDASGNAIEAQIGPTVDDVVNYLAGQKMITITENTDVTVDGHRGKYLEYATTLGVDNCHGPEWPLITHLDEVHEFTQAWILDIDGVRLVVDAYSPQASEPLKAEFQQIVDSISIGP
jgi:hypothetical protein